MYQAESSSWSSLIAVMVRLPTSVQRQRPLPVKNSQPILKSECFIWRSPRQTCGTDLRFRLVLLAIAQTYLGASSERGAVMPHCSERPGLNFQ
ncbi:MAG: hypothetical protein WB760_34975 [Xanthobacteraceae bacterium]